MSAEAPQLEAVPPGIGVVAPFDMALDRELWRWTPPPVSLYVTRTAPVDGDVSVDQARALGDLAAITDACRNVSSASPAVTAFLCTSASFVSGVAGEARVRTAMEAGGARHAVTTSGALLEAVRALGAGRLAVGTPYDAALTERLVAFLAEAGVATSGTRHLGMGGDIWRVSADSVLELARGLPLDGADAVFLACTNLRTYEVIPPLEAELGIPVLSANLVTMWSALRRLGQAAEKRPERLFAVR
jgi:maleate isomerase